MDKTPRYFQAVVAQSHRDTPEGEAAYAALIQKWLEEDSRKVSK